MSPIKLSHQPNGAQRISYTRVPGGERPESHNGKPIESKESALSWRDVRKAFKLDKQLIHLGTSQSLSSHPRPVRKAIRRLRRALDSHPLKVLERYEEFEGDARRAVAHLIGADAEDVALTDNTTTGLGLVYGGLAIDARAEIVTSSHEHMSHAEALRGLSGRTGAGIRRFALYDGPASSASADELVVRVMAALTPATRVLALSWVYADTGLRIPIAQIAATLHEYNKTRAEHLHVLLCVDGAHALGVELDGVGDLGCDFLFGDLHKGVHGPRGTGFAWGKTEEWRRLLWSTPSWTEGSATVDDAMPPQSPSLGRQFTPGGYHAFEHRWSVPAAIDFLERIGRTRIRAHIHHLNARCRAGLRTIRGITVETPDTEDLSSGITTFRADGIDAEQLCVQLLEHSIIATVAHPGKLLRFTPGIYNDEHDVDKGLEAVQSCMRSLQATAAEPAHP